MRRSARAAVVVVAIGVVVALIAGCSHALVEPTPLVASIAPSLACARAPTTTVLVAGANLTPLPTKTLAGGEELVLPSLTLAQSTDLAGAAMSPPPIALAARWQSEQQMSFDLTAALALSGGVYDVTVENPDGKTATLPSALGLVPAPSVTTMPPAICDSPAMDRTVTLAGQDFLVAGATAPQVELLDGTGAVALTLTATASSCQPAATTLPMPPTLALCTTLSVTIPKNALAAGSYTVRVVDPAPMSCASSGTVTLILNRGNC